MSYAIPDPPTPEEHEDDSEPEIGMLSESPEEIMRRAEQQDALEALGLPRTAITAFVVFLTEDGTWMANSNLVGHKEHMERNGQRVVDTLGKLPPIEAMEIRRQATLQEMGQAAAVMQFDVANLIGAQITVNSMQALAQQQMAQARQQAEAQAIYSRLGQQPGGLMGPNGRPV